MRNRMVLLWISLLAATAITGCGKGEAEQPTPQAVVTEEKGTIKIAASATPHAEILEQAKILLEKEGWNLEIQIFDDFVQPNMVVDSGDFDANYFQHVQYLESFNAEKGTQLVDAGDIHYELFGIYPGTETDLANIKEEAVIAVPNDTTNEARALLLLQENGLITLKEGSGLKATVRDIVDNPKNIKFQELESAQIPRVKNEVSFMVLNGNYALQAGFNVVKDAVATEKADSEDLKNYVNLIAVKQGNESSESITALVTVLKSDEIKKFIEDTWDGAVVPFT